MRSAGIVGAFAAAAVAASPALAENWRLAPENDSLALYLDMDSVERTGGGVRFRQQVRHREVRTLSSGLQWDTDSLLTEADCGAMTFVHVETVARLRGKIVLSYGGGERAQARPGTLIASAIETACAAAPEPATAI